MDGWAKNNPIIILAICLCLLLRSRILSSYSKYLLLLAHMFLRVAGGGVMEDVDSWSWC